MHRGDYKRTGRVTGQTGPSAPGSMREQWRDTTEFSRALQLAAAGEYVFSDPGNIRITNATSGDVVSTGVTDGLRRPRRPLVHDGTVYTSNYRGVVAGIDGHSGSVQWSYDPGGIGKEDDPNAIRFPVTGTPVRHADGLLFEVPYVDEYDSRRGTKGLIECVKAGATSSEQRCWDAAYITPNRASGALMVVDGTLVLPIGGNVHTYDIESIERVWTHETRSATAVAADGTRVIATLAHGEVVAYDVASGSERWRTQVEGPNGQGLSVVYPPAVTDRGVVVVGVSDGTLRGLDAASGEFVWQVAVGEPVAYWTNVALDGDVGYVGAHEAMTKDGDQRSNRGSGWLYAVDVRSGEELWSTSMSGKVSAPVVTAGGVLTAVDGDIVRYS